MVMTVEEKKEAQKLYYKNYWIKNKKKKAKYRKENKDAVAKCKRDWAIKNAEKNRKSSSLWALNNVAKTSAKNANYRAKKFGATIYMTKEDKAKIAELYTIAKDASKLFGYGWEVDHIVPLNKGGLHKLSNLQVVPASWNSAKRDRNSDVYWG